MDSFYGDLGNDDTHEGDISDVDISEVEDVLGAVGGFSTNLFSSIQKNKPESSSQTTLDASSVKTTQQGSGDSAVKIVKPQVSESPKKLSFSNKKLFSTDFDEADPLGDLLSDEESSPPKKASVKHEDSTTEPEKSEEKTNNRTRRNDKSGIISKLFGLDKKVIKPDSSTADVSLSAEKSPFKQTNVSAVNTKEHSVNISADSVVKDKSLKDDKLGKPASDSSLFGVQLSKENKLSKPISDSSLLINQNFSPNRKFLPDNDENINDLLEDNSKEVLSKVVKDVQSAQKWTEKQKSSAGASSYVPSVVTTRESRRSVVKKNISDIFDPLGIVSTAQPTVDKSNENSAASKKVEASTLDSSVIVDMPHKQIDSDIKKSEQSANVYSPIPSEQLSRNLSKSDWLGISDNSFNDILDDNVVKHSPSHSSRRTLAITVNQSKLTPSAVISPSRNATSPDKAHHSKMKTDNENVVNLPEWLGGKPESSPVKKKTPVEQKHPPSTSTNVDAKQLSESETADAQRILSNFTDVLQTGKHFDEAAVSFLQHQDIQLLVALHLKQREKEMASLNSHQQDILLRQENLLQQLIDKQLTRQKVMEEKFKEQQDRINHYVQALMDQTQEEPLPRLSASTFIEKHDSNKEAQEQAYARYEEEMQTMRSTYAHQISLLQEALERQEKRLKHEISQLEAEHRTTVLKMQEERKLLEEEYQKKIKLLQEEKLLDIQHVKEFYHKELESLRSYYVKTVDDIHKSSAQNRYMTMLNEKLDESTLQLNKLQEKIQKSSESYHDLKESVLKSNESEIREFSQKLDIQSKIYEQKHQNLVKLISQLEERILKQRSEIDAKNFKLQQETLKFETRVREFELEKQKLQQNRKEDLQSTPEKHSHNTPTGNMKVKHNKEMSETSTHYNTRPNLQPGIIDADKIRKEAEMAIQTTHQAFQQVRLEKEKLAEEHKQLIQEQRRLKEYEKRLTIKAQELDVLTQVAVSTKKQGLHALEEAKYIELKQNIQITDIQRQLSELKEREVKLGKEKAELMYEKDTIEKMKKTRYCELCKTLLKHSKTQQQSSSVSLSQVSGNKTSNIVDPEYIILKYSAEKDIEQSLIQSILPSR